MFIMKDGMFSMCHKFKIFNAVIGNISVYMMNVLVFFQRTFEIFRHNKSMKHDISIISSVRVARHFNHNITVMMFNPIFPSVMIRAYSKTKKAFVRTKGLLVLLNSARPMIDLFSAVSTSYKNGLISRYWRMFHVNYNILTITNCQGEI